MTFGDILPYKTFVIYTKYKLIFCCKLQFIVINISYFFFIEALVIEKTLELNLERRAKF